MKRKRFLKSLATFIAAPYLIENVGVEDKPVLLDSVKQYSIRMDKCMDEPPQWAQYFYVTTMCGGHKTIEYRP